MMTPFHKESGGKVFIMESITLAMTETCIPTSKVGVRGYKARGDEARKKKKH